MWDLVAGPDGGRRGSVAGVAGLETPESLWTNWPRATGVTPRAHLPCERGLRVGFVTAC